jgi:hypothetical protein
MVHPKAAGRQEPPRDERLALFGELLTRYDNGKVADSIEPRNALRERGIDVLMHYPPGQSRKVVRPC